jgi:hypothetical protein
MIVQSAPNLLEKSMEGHDTLAEMIQLQRVFRMLTIEAPKKRLSRKLTVGKTFKACIMNHYRKKTTD